MVKIDQSIFDWIRKIPPGCTFFLLCSLVVLVGRACIVFWFRVRARARACVCMTVCYDMRAHVCVFVFVFVFVCVCACTLCLPV